MSRAKRTAIITGGASGMGLAVAEALTARGDWDIHLIDMNVAAGEAAAATLSATFHQGNVTSYPSLSTIFKTVYQTSSRLDFVFANAGIGEKGGFCDRHGTGAEPPPPPNLASLNVNLDSVAITSYLALHYFRLSAVEGQDKVLTMTASCGGLYPSYYSPLYSAAKHGVVGLMRSVAKHFWTYDKIRCNAICPGVVKTNLLTAKEWENFPEQYFTPVESIVKGVLLLLDGKSSEAERIDGESGREGCWGEALEISGTKLFFREPVKVCDEGMRAVMKATDIQELES